MQQDLLKNVLTIVALVLIIVSFLYGVSLESAAAAVAAVSSNYSTATPIKHLVIMFQENVSFDHYFATYPNATNPPGEPAFHASSHTSSVNGLTGGTIDQ